MLRRTYDWTMSLAGHPHAIWWLALLTCVESVVFPIPPDVLIIPMVLAARRQAWRIAAVATTASVVGGVLGYGAGFFLYEEIGKPIIEFYGYAAKYDTFQGWYTEYGAWIVAAGGFTPIPYKVITIASGVAQLDLTTFMIVSVLSRGARFLIVSFNNEGHLARDEVRALLEEYGETTVFETDYRRYVGARIGIHNPQGQRVGRVSHVRNKEFLFVVSRESGALGPVRSAMAQFDAAHAPGA